MIEKVIILALLVMLICSRWQVLDLRDELKRREEENACSDQSRMAEQWGVL